MEDDAMARPRKEGMDYFPHDTDAVNDEKIEALRALYGNDGYAFYFILLERIYRSPNFELIVSDAETLQILSRKVAVTQQKFDEMLATAFKYGCFDETSYHERNVLTSNGIRKRAVPVLEKRRKMRENDTGVSDAETQQKLSRNSAETGESKVKNSKVKDHRVKPVIDYFFNKYKERMMVPYPVQGSKDGSLIKKIPKEYDTDTIFGLIDLFFDDKDPFIEKAGYTIGVFYSRLPALAPKLKPKEVSQWKPGSEYKRLQREILNAASLESASPTTSTSRT